MNFKKLFSIILLLISVQSFGFQLSKSVNKKVHKELEKTYEIKGLTLEAIEISSAVNAKLPKKINSHQLFKIQNDNTLLGYAYIDKAPSKTDEFDYLIIFDTNYIIKKTKVLIYREDYGGEIGSRRWLKQFIGKTTNDQMKYEKDIIAISGATISAHSMTVAVNTFLRSLSILQQEKLF